MPVRSGPVRRASSSRASCGRLSASALGPWSPWLSSSKMLSACTSPWRTIADRLLVGDVACAEHGVDGEVDGLERREQQLGARAGEDGRVGERAERQERLPALAELGLDAQALRPAPVAGHDADARLEQAQHVVLERDEAPLAVVVEDDRLRLEVVVHLGLAEAAAQAASDEPLQRRGGRALAAEVVGEALVGVALVGEHVGELGLAQAARVREPEAALQLAPDVAALRAHDGRDARLERSRGVRRGARRGRPRDARRRAPRGGRAGRRSPRATRRGGRGARRRWRRRRRRSPRATTGG